VSYKNKNIQEAKRTEQPPKETDRPRIAKLAAPAEPVTFDHWCDVIAANFPSLVKPAEVCLSVIAQLLLNDVSNPFALALVDVPSSGKTITLNFFGGEPELTYTSDNFSPASFVSHASNVKREDLDDVDLLPRIRYRTLIVRELGPVFGANDDDLRKQLGILTRVLDGEGLQTDSGVHGRRGYEGDYLFMMLAGTPPIAPRVFKVMGNFGSRLFFLQLHTPEERAEDLIAQNLGEDRKCREDACKRATKGFLRTLWAVNQAGITWNKAGDSRDYLRVIAQCAILLAALRGAINVWPVGEDGEKLSHSIPVIEKPNRINCLFYNLARAHALVCGRRQLTAEDLWPVLDLTFDSAPRTRAKVFRGLIESGGTLTTSEVENFLCCSKHTALKEMEALSILGVVEKTGIPGHEGRPETLINLKDKFEWFTSEECQALLNRAHTPSVVNAANPPCVNAEAASETSQETVTQGENRALTQVCTTKADNGVATEARPILTSLIGRIRAEGNLHPKGHPDCPWGEHYPAEYTAALNFLSPPALEGQYDQEDIKRLYSDQKAHEKLSRLMFKIEAEDKRGTPLQSNRRVWSGGGFPAEYHAAQAYLADQAKRSPFPDMTDEEWLEYDARFKAGKALLTDGSPDILSGHWLHFRDAADFRAFYGKEGLLPETCVGLDDSGSRSELEAVQDTLSCGCKLADEPDGFFYHPGRNTARCTDCQSAEWIAQGFEVENGFPYGDWQATTERRLAEQARIGREQAEADLRWIKSEAGQKWLEAENRRFVASLKEKAQQHGWTQEQLRAEAESYGLIR